MAEVSLDQILNARDKRVNAQKNLIRKYKQPIISFTMNIAGPEKINPLVHRAFTEGLRLLEKKLCGIKISEKSIICEDTGYEALFSADADAFALKKICTAIEDGSDLGRLFDMDVITVDGDKLEREKLRGCIVCKKSGRECAASRAHTVDVLQRTTKEIIINYFAETDFEHISNLAVKSLYDEVDTTPKPGLVDSRNNGSHKDMDIHSFILSANALKPYFKKCLYLGHQTRANDAHTLFPLLKQEGLGAEQKMYLATDGVNTHKGIIYSFGIICGALGRLWTAAEPYADIDSVTGECIKICAQAVKDDFKNATGSTSGERLYIEKGIKGIRGEAESGFESVKSTGLPIFKKALSHGLNRNDSAVVTLLHFIAAVPDTNLYSRGGDDGALFARKTARALLEKHQYPPKEDVEKADIEFIKRNLSPGGCADLLSITYFLYDLYDR